VTPWTPAPPGGGGGRGRSRGHGGCFSVPATAPFFRSVKPEGLPPSGGNKPGGLPPPGVLYCLQPAARPLPAAGGQSAGPGGPGGDPLDPAPPGGRGWQRPFPRAMLSFFSSSATAPFFRSVKPEGLLPSGGNKPGGLPPPGVLNCLQPAALPLPAAGGQSPVQGVTPWPPWRGRGRFLRLRRSRTCPRAGSAQSGSRHW